ncbi:MAG: type II toxin-antitoxin system VapB family antitoxin [Rhizobiaceae bacterium]|nr:type II toxin-antitoxin system VapB family antitoxin [Rhizobiaceae bacterium]
MLVRELARMRGIGITDAIKEAVQAAIDSDRRQAERDLDASLEERLKPLFERLDRLPRPPLSTDRQFFDSLWADEGSSSNMNDGNVS